MPVGANYHSDVLQECVRVGILIQVYVFLGVHLSRPASIFLNNSHN